MTNHYPNRQYKLEKKNWMQDFRNPSTQCKLHAAEDEQETV